MKNNCLKFLFLLLVLFPINIYAYSNRLIIGGETIGIEAYSKGIYIVGFYDVDNKAIAKDAGFKIGDIIDGYTEDVLNTTIAPSFAKFRIDCQR